MQYIYSKKILSENFTFALSFQILLSCRITLDCHPAVYGQPHVHQSDRSPSYLPQPPSRGQPEGGGGLSHKISRTGPPSDFHVVSPSDGSTHHQIMFVVVYNLKKYIAGHTPLFSLRHQAKFLGKSWGPYSVLSIELSSVVNIVLTVEYIKMIHCGIQC